MSSDSNNKTELSEALSSLNIGGDDELNNNDINTVAICANCGKGEECSGDLKSCTACKMVKYCNRDCQIAHRPQHKKACKKRAAELYDEELFREHPPPEDCPICFLPLPTEDGITFEACCGKNICNGCIYAMNEREGAKLCAFCRTPCAESGEDNVKRNKILMEKGNADAYYQLAGYYVQGNNGLPQDWAKANELYVKAGELGCAGAYYNLGCSYNIGTGVDIDEKKAKHYFELAAMNGCVVARHNLGCVEGLAGNHHRATKHFLLAARAGFKQSLDMVKKGFMGRAVTKEEYSQALRAYQKRHDEMKSDTRDKAANF